MPAHTYVIQKELRITVTVEETGLFGPKEPKVEVELLDLDPNFLMKRAAIQEAHERHQREAAEATQRALEATEAKAILERTKLTEEAQGLLEGVTKLAEAIQATDFSRAHSREVFDHYAGLHHQAVMAQRFVERHGLEGLDQAVVAMRRLVAPRLQAHGLRL